MISLILPNLALEVISKFRQNKFQFEREKISRSKYFVSIFQQSKFSRNYFDLKVIMISGSKDRISIILRSGFFRS